MSTNPHLERRKNNNIVSKPLIDKMIEDYVNCSDWQVHENSNMAFSLQGLHQYISTQVSKAYWLEKIYPEAVCKAHEQGDFHIHQLQSLSVYCVGWDLQQLLQEGFCGVRNKVESSPPKHFRTALRQVADFIFTLQGESAGAQAFSNFDTLLAPFIAYDKLNDEQVEKTLEEFLFSLNMSTRAGFQTPFSNISLDLTVPEYLKDQPVLIGGKPQEQTYKEFQKQIDQFNRIFFAVMLKGDAKERVFTFPIPTYSITKDFQWDNPNLKGLWELTAKFGVPYFSNFINSDLTPEDIRAMCCRLRIDHRQLKRTGGGYFGAGPLTGSIGTITINLPRLGFISASEEEFFERLFALMVLAKEALEVKRQFIEDFTEKQIYPYTHHYLRHIKDKEGSYWCNHFSTIGIVGMNEALLNLYDINLTSQKGQEFALRVLEFMKEKLVEFQQETGWNFNLEATPSESTAYRLACKDKAQFPDCIVANENEYRTYGAPPFYTNSTQLPVDATDDMFEALRLQDELQASYTGGTILHFFLGEKISDPDVVKSLVKKICTQYQLPYFTFTPTFSICPVHRYLEGEVFTCPQCGNTCEVYSRIVGYLRPVDQWNNGKKAEYAMRRTFTVPK